MAGLRRRFRQSLRLRLSLWLSAIVLVVAVLAAVASFFMAYGEAHELQDEMLRQTAALFDATHLPAGNRPGVPAGADVDSDEHLLIALLPDSAATARSGVAGAFSADWPNGLQTHDLHGTRYRIYIRRLDSGQRLAVAQQTAVRNEAATADAVRALVPFAVLVPLLLLAIADLLRKMFRPVAQLAAEVETRSEQALHPVSTTSVPDEIRPFIDAINRLLSRVQDSMRLQRQFIAAAAHELRSPLTALSLQAERLEAAHLPDDARQRLTVLRRGIARNRELTEQLLAYARAQAGGVPGHSTASVQAVFRRALEDVIELAHARQQDIGVANKDDLQLALPEVELTTAVKNLLVNAIRYTPVGGRIDVWMERGDGTARIVVEDNGPGIGAERRAQALAPFQRLGGNDTEGSGLGLSIVKLLMDRAGGRITLEPARNAPTGLRATLHLPLT